MIQVLDHQLIYSFQEYLQHRILNDLQAFKNKTVDLYSYSPSRLPTNKKAYGSAYQQWIYDSSISGVQVPSGVGTLNRGISGLYIDFFNGRVVCNSGVNLPTGRINVSVPEIRTYITTKSESKLIFEQKFEEIPVNSVVNRPIEEDAVVAPCIFIKIDNSDNKPWNLGGLAETTWRVRVSVFVDNEFRLYGLQKVFRDINQQFFPLLSSAPLNENDDLKTGYWNYNNEAASAGANHNNLIYIEDSTFKVYDDDTVAKLHPKMILGVATFTLKKYRPTN